IWTPQCIATFLLDRENLASSRISGLYNGELPLALMVSSIVTRLLIEGEAFSAIVPIRFCLVR
ncbi:MAG: hypothetical protein N0E58_15480, partial [Candidatus Thiodiazotropha endolucinida]|nr:hypothetical protein [Candidatus Thiodiazotropha taylori]MCW4237651.1 hypothetical protein [Candidatus Thiodiazotropha endolucinida]